MNNPKDMLVSDERLRELRDESENMIVFGREVRAIYEAELTKLRSEKDELVGALESCPNPHGGEYHNNRILSMAVTALRDSGHMTLGRELEDMCANQQAIIAKHKPE